MQIQTFQLPLGTLFVDTCSVVVLALAPILHLFRVCYFTETGFVIVWLKILNSAKTRNWREKIEFGKTEFGKSENYAELGNFSCDFYVNLA